jgi:polysaccharide export outer membrane protein
MRSLSARLAFLSPLAASFATALVATLGGCADIASSGFLRGDLKPERIQQADPGLQGMQLVDLTDAVARKVIAQKGATLFSETFGTTPIQVPLVGPGDVIEISIWEAPPATLFNSASIDPRLGALTSRVMTMPEQIVSKEGFLNVPFAGPIRAVGRTLPQIEGEIAEKLKGKANQPQVLARLLRNASSSVTVVGEVAASTLLPLTPRGERLLDAIAAAGGVRQPINKTTIQVTRGRNVHQLPLDVIIRDPQQNVPLHPGDVVTALFQPFSFTAFGATGKNDEITFEAQGITLAQALARAGGLQDARADSQGLYLFRFEPLELMTWPRQPVLVTLDGRVPVIYRIDLKNPASFFIAQNFPVQNKDLIYAANASGAELQKFLNLVFSVIYPITAATTVFQRN